ncbi:MAG: hypothetical protein JWL80_236 [Parcubacteria group bacterium]|nr:hypothetical protein [Parcubacteria group bacterium]
MKNTYALVIIVVAIIGGYFLLRAHPTTPIEIQDANPAVSSGKLNSDVVCKSALTYMTFTDSASADLFVAECKEGKHPEVFERYKAQLNLGDGAAI